MPPKDVTKCKFAFVLENVEWEEVPEKEDRKMKLFDLVKLFGEDLFEIHFAGHDSEGYICGELLTGDVCRKVLRADILNSRIIKSEIEVYGDDCAGICVTVDYKLNLDEGVSE